MKSRWILLFWLAALCAACMSVPATPQPQTPAATPALASPPRPKPSATLAPSATAAVSILPPALPSATPSPTSPAPSPATLRLLFTGDISPGRCVYSAALQVNDMAWPYRLLADRLQSADLTIGSLDASLSDYNPPVPCAETRNLMAPAATVQGLQFAGFDMITLATNHAKDCGLERGCKDNAFYDTLANLKKAGIAAIGAGRTLTEALAPAIITVEGVRFAFLGFSAVGADMWATDSAPGTAPFKEELYLAAIRQARAQADVVIVLPHWGAEYSPEINWEQYNAAPRMVEAGATLIVGNHPHRVQGQEVFPGGAVAVYALGNFIFDQRWSDNTQYTQEGLLLSATFSGAHLQGVELIPISISEKYQPRLASLEEGREILRQAAEALAPLPPRK